MKKEAVGFQSGGGWSTNMGNAFVDLGSMYSLNKALEKKDENVILHSNFPKAFLFRGGFSHKGRFLDGSFRDRIGNLVDIRDYLNTKYIIFSGDLLREPWWKITLPSKVMEKNSKYKIIINGGGGSLYTPAEFEAVRNYLKRINLYAFISRDEVIFKEYSGIAEHTFNGIDCAFFIKNCFDLLSFDYPKYITLTFDKSKEPAIGDCKDNIIRLSHNAWSQSGGLFKWIYYRYKQSNRKENFFISDLPQDYLAIYSNTRGTYSDLVHACVPTLAYGNRARFYSKSPRGNLFDRVGAGSIRNELTSIDLNNLRKEQSHHIKFLSEIL